MEYDAINEYDLVYCEIRQQRESGHDVGPAEQRLAALAPDDRSALLDLFDQVACSPPLPGWAYHEPSALADIVATLPPAVAEVPERLEDRIHGGWLGRVAGCMVGKPIEMGWTPTQAREYLLGAGGYPLRDYVPASDPPSRKLHWTWPTTTRDRIDGAVRDDDIDYSILGLLLYERCGAELRTRDVADAWLSALPFRQTYTAERVAYRNLVSGVPLDEVGTFRNPYREWIGAQIRADIFGWTHPGDPRAAAVASHTDARLSHVGNGIYGEMWAAALVAAAFVAPTAEQALRTSLAHIPPHSRLTAALTALVAVHDTGGTWQDAIELIEREYGHHIWVHTIPNAAIIAAGMLWGRDDFATTVGLTVQAGLDTDSNGATAGSVMGVLHGAAALPPYLIDPLRDTVRSAVFGVERTAISDLARRTAVLVSSRS
ncbi:MAG TPA: ADP-ribosylglycohydrolase family protein [Jatrophihabitans sp.]|nr:ADP-ribosylglycohydrolase family protein [Jatrophihabitans sp.]